MLLHKTENVKKCVEKAKINTNIRLKKNGIKNPAILKYTKFQKHIKLLKLKLNFK